MKALCCHLDEICILVRMGAFCFHLNGITVLSAKLELCAFIHMEVLGFHANVSTGL